MPRPYVRQDYHDDQPRWRTNFQGNGKYVGVELEISHNDGYERLLELLPFPGGRGRRPIVEEDGSLNYTFAAEIVFPPYKYDQMKNPDGFFGRSMRALREGGAERGYNCGMHMNINTKGWSEEKQGAFAALINVLPAQWLTNLGGREANDYCRRVHYDQIYNYGPEQYNEDHTLADVHNGRIECRFPAATVEHEDIVVLVDFFDYVEQAVSDKKFVSKLEDLLATHCMSVEDWEDEQDKYRRRHNWEENATQDDFTGYDDAAELFENFLDTLPQTDNLLVMKEKMQNAHRPRPRKAARAA